MMMRLLRTRWFVISAIVLALVVPGAWLMARNPGPGDESVVARVKRGDFKVVVTTAGELRSRKFVQIQGPQNAQQADAYQMKIASIVPEGTQVKEGDIVAELDRSTLAAKMAEVTLALTKATAQYEQAMLDSTLNLSKAREEMRTMELSLEEKKIAKDQAIYEAPSIQRQAAIDHERAMRALAQAKIDYKTRTEQAQAKMREVGTDLDRQRNKLKVVQDVMGGFTIRAPAAGMVIYVKEWNGRKKTAGSQVNPWDPTVATLPDLTQMESITYVNEIDVRKVAAGQPVSITLDADPSKLLTGKVVSVANVGEQRPNADAKVFEVKITVDKPDTTLRPGMTTGNGVETFAIKNALYIPLEALSSEEGVSYVHRRAGGRIVKQEVETGAMNDDEVVIVRGLDADDEVLLSPPDAQAQFETVRLPGSGNTPKPAGGDSAAGPKPVPVNPTPVPPARAERGVRPPTHKGPSVSAKS
jgi:RND family efflux transporter MFP subunit